MAMGKKGDFGWSYKQIFLNGCLIPIPIQCYPGKINRRHVAFERLTVFYSGLNFCGLEARVQPCCTMMSLCTAFVAAATPKAFAVILDCPHKGLSRSPKAEPSGEWAGYKLNNNNNNNNNSCLLQLSCSFPCPLFPDNLYKTCLYLSP